MGSEVMTIRPEESGLMNMSFDSVLELADRSEKMVEALNKIMSSAIKITASRDWVLIGGKPYLQESGASKVAGLFGISWRICEGYPKREIENGFPIYTYRMQFTMGGKSIEAEGMRNAADDFFTSGGKKSVDQIDLADVKRAAYTNCLNRGIKSILPGLRNLEVEDLANAGINLSRTSGYTFKPGSKGGKTESEKSEGLSCSGCGKKVSQKVASFSEGKFGRILCMDCQKSGVQVETSPEDEFPPYPPEEGGY